jgi:Zn ribbon nucleic-acid-binding protein
MTCFCGCKTFENDPDGKILGCVNCNHGRQNHDEEFREAARKNEQQSQKRDTDFG